MMKLQYYIEEAKKLREKKEEKLKKIKEKEGIKIKYEGDYTDIC